jgi:plastocyanin
MKSLLSVSALLMLLLIACDDDNNDETRPENEVWMSANSFLPASLVVTQGTTVRWVNNSSMTHNLVSDTGLFNETLNPGQSYSFTFNNNGLFNYECTLHPGMTGSITVGDSGGSPNGGDEGDGGDGGY